MSRLNVPSLSGKPLLIVVFLMLMTMIDSNKFNLLSNDQLVSDFRNDQ